MGSLPTTLGCGGTHGGGAAAIGEEGTAEVVEATTGAGAATTTGTTGGTETTGRTTMGIVTDKTTTGTVTGRTTMEMTGTMGIVRGRITMGMIGRVSCCFFVCVCIPFTCIFVRI